MKKYLLLLVSASAFSQTISIPDPIFKSKLISEGVDTNSDGQIQFSEAEAVLILDIGIITPNPAKIQDIEGIQYFVNLQELEVQGHNIDVLDVTMLSQLRKLYCFDNGMSTLNISGLANLEWVWCMSNDLTSLDVSGLNSLEWMFCSDNNLTSLAVENLPALKYLFAASNSISALNLLPLQNLEEIEVYDNLLTHLDVNHLQALVRLNCGQNQITSLDLSNMPDLMYLHVGENLLQSLDCTETGIITLDCSNNPNLQSVFVKNGAISYSDPDLLHWGLLFTDLPALQFICIDPFEQAALDMSGYDSANVTVSVTSCELSVDEQADDVMFKIVPNPVDDYATIFLAADVEMFSIIDISGKLLFKSAEKFAVENYMSSLQSGFYLMNAESMNENSALKFIKN